MSKKVWISRSQPGASALANKLAISKISVMQMPVLTINPINCLYPQERPKLVICLSGHAARIYMDSGKSLANKKIKHLAIGRETASILGSRFASIITPLDERSEGVIGMKEVREISAGDIVWLLTGRQGRGLVESALENKGCKLYRLALYEQVRKEVEGIDPENISCVVVGSAVGMQHVAEFWKRYKGEPSIPIIAPSLRVKKEAESLGFTDVYNLESANVTDVSTFVKEFLAAH